MPKMIILGSANAVPDARHENTYLVILDQERTVLIDCTGSPIPRLEKAGVDPQNITDIILTHFHPDHVAGLPLLLMGMWLLGRKHPLHIYGLSETIERAEALMDLFYWSEWPGLYRVTFHIIPNQEMSPVLDCTDFRVFASPVRHILPTLGLRFEFPKSGTTLAYSSDTEPCPEVVRLARQATVLVHESSGDYQGHSTATQAAEVALKSQAQSLYLIHYPARSTDPQLLVAEAKLIFPGDVALAEDFMEIKL